MMLAFAYPTPPMTQPMQLAQLNVARLLAPIDSPQLVDFVAQLDEINALAEGSPGFVWRFEGDAREGSTSAPGDEELIINLSVWASSEALFDYVYRSAHKSVMTRRREWFAKAADMHMVLWWVPAGHWPDIAEAMQRLAELNAKGPSPAAFSFREAFGADGRPLGRRALTPAD